MHKKDMKKFVIFIEVKGNVDKITNDRVVQLKSVIFKKKSIGMKIILKFHVDFIFSFFEWYLNKKIFSALRFSERFKFIARRQKKVESIRYLDRKSVKNVDNN